MDKPTNLAFSDEATFTFLRGEILIPFVTIASVFIAVLVTSEDPFTGLALPAAAMSAAWLGWAGLFVLIAWGHRFWEKYLINRMFAGEIWECWQFSSTEWQAQVEGVCNLISPKDEGLEAYIGAVYSSIFGIVIALIMILVTIFAVEETETKIALRIGAVIVFLLFLGAGLFQPMIDRYRADRYRRKALQIAEPRVWFAFDGIYHETLGHTSLKDLNKITDQTRSRKAIQFTLVVSTDSADDLVKIPFPVPSGCEERAGRLVRRYRQERLLT
ncbi:MAG: hypothetical protein WBB69_00220 [Anaerolineales bacterium]